MANNSSRTRILICAICMFFITACQPSSTSTTPTATPETRALSTTTPVPSSSPTNSPTEKPTKTPFPTYTPRPTNTPKPSPTLPAGDDFSCLPAKGTRTSAIVSGVTDGDTIIVQIGLLTFPVRYIGINTPETNVDPPERMGPEATTRNRELVSGNRVTLVSDPEVGDTDRYGRLLRFVLVEDTFVNVLLVREGFARYYASPNACGKLIFSSETEARSNKVGLWAP